jgi:hypothetical protein
MMDVGIIIGVWNVLGMVGFLEENLETKMLHILLAFQLFGILLFLMSLL